MSGGKVRKARVQDRGWRSAPQRQEPVVTDRPAHGSHGQADIRSGRRYWLERPLYEAQLTKGRGWAEALFERLLSGLANSQCRSRAVRQLLDLGCRETVTQRPSFTDGLNKSRFRRDRTCSVYRVKSRLQWRGLSISALHLGAWKTTAGGMNGSTLYLRVKPTLAPS